MTTELTWDLIATFCGLVFLWHAIMQAHRTSYRTMPPLVLANVMIAVGAGSLFAAAVPDVVDAALVYVNASLPAHFLYRVHLTERWAKPLGWGLIGAGFALTCLFERRDGRSDQHRGPAQEAA